MRALKSKLTTVLLSSNRKSGNRSDGKQSKRSKKRIKRSVDAQFANAQAIETFIGPGSVLDGDLICSGGLRVEGEIRGNIESKDENGSVVICNKAKVFGDVHAPYLVVDGNVHGNVHSNRSLLLEPNAVVAGDVRYHEINMSLGSRVNGELVPRPRSRRR